MNNKIKKAAVLLLTAVLSSGISASAEEPENTPVPEAGASKEAAVGTEADVTLKDDVAPEAVSGLDQILFGEYQYETRYDDKNNAFVNSYTNSFFHFSYNTFGGFNKENTLPRLNDMNKCKASSMEELYEQLNERLNAGESVCVMYAATSYDNENPENYPKINISLSRNEEPLTAADLEAILQQAEPEIRSSLPVTEEDAKEAAVIDYESSEDDHSECGPFGDMEHFSVSISFTVDETTYYSRQIYLFQESLDAEAPEQYICCVTITCTDPDDITAVLSNFQKTREDENAEPSPSEAASTAEPVPASGDPSVTAGGSGSDDEADFPSEAVEDNSPNNIVVQTGAIPSDNAKPIETTVSSGKGSSPRIP